jgi:hypothetical protein
MNCNYMTKKKRYPDEGHDNRNRINRRKSRRFIWASLRGKSCIGCGEPDPVVLQYDHQEPNDKILAVCEMANRGWSIKRIAAELLKCVVLCANCHTRRTAKQFGWYDEKHAFISS